MKNSSDRHTAEAAASVAQSAMPGVGRIFWGLSTMTIGGSLAGVMAGVMAVATFQGVSEDGFFGVGVAGMVAVFGAQLVKLGYDMAMGRPKMATDPDPLDALWHSNRRVYPYLPYSHLEIRGR